MGTSGLYILMTTLTIITFVIIFFILIRELVCWYYKINERISLLEENNKLLSRLIDLLDHKKIDSTSSPNISSYFFVSENDIDLCTHNYALFIASKYNQDNKNDWRVPTADELQFVFEDKEKYPFLKKEIYWSSTEKDKSGLIAMNFSDGTVDTYRPSNNFRAFFVRGSLGRKNLD